MRILIILITFSIANSLFANDQHKKIVISGYVKNAISKEPLVGVTIIDKELKGTTTNSYGFYSLTSHTGEIDLTFSYIGYNPTNKKFVADSDTEMDVMLNVDALKSPEVVVVAKKHKFSDNKTLGRISLNSDQLKYIPTFLGERDIFKYFQLQPGVSAGKEGSSDMNLRGGSSDQTLILLDDIPIYNHSHAFGFASIFSGDYIKSAELYKGYAPSSYGGRLSGVATMSINEGNRTEHKQSLQIGTTTAAAVFEGPINGGKGSYFVGGRYFVPDLFFKAASLFMSKDNSMSPSIGFYDITAKVSYDLNKKHTLHTSFYTGHDAISFTSNDIETMPEGGQEKTRDKTGIKWGNIVGSIRLSSKLNNKLFMTTTAYYSHIYNAQKSKFENYTEESIINSKVQSRMGELGLKLNFEQNINDWYNISYGLNASSQHFSPKNVSMNYDSLTSQRMYGSRNLFTATTFVENKFQYKKFELNAGLRFSLYHNNNESKMVLEPRVALTYRMKNSSLWGSYAENSQPIFSMNQQLFTMPVDYWVPFQNANELPRSRQFSVGYKHSTNFGMDFTTELYMKKSRNVAIVYNSDDFLLEEGGYNLAKGTAYGFEFMVQYELKKLNLALSYVYSKSEYNVDGRKINFMYDTPHDLNLFASYETLRRGSRTHTLSMNLHYNTGLPYVISNELYPNADPSLGWEDVIVNNPMYANTRLVDFFRLDFNYSMEKQLKKGSRIWQLSLLNATGYKNPYIVYKKNSGFVAISIIPILPSFSYIRKF